MERTVKQYQIKYKGGTKANQMETFDFTLPELRIGRDRLSQCGDEPLED